MAFAFLLLAASAALAQPVCAASEPLTVLPQDGDGSHDDRHGEPCCAELDVIVGTAPDIASSPGLAPLFLAAWSRPLLTAALLSASSARLPALPLPPPLPYHARSARILR